MSMKFELWFDVISPAAWLAWTQLPKLMEETGAKAVYRPMLLGGIFKQAGSSANISTPAKWAYNTEDFPRVARSLGVPYELPKGFPVRTVHLMRGLEAYRDDPQFQSLADCFFKGLWEHGLDMDDGDVLANAVTKAGIDAGEFERRINDPAIKQALIDATNEAVERGVFGAPFIFVGDARYWGQDRLEFVRHHLATGKPL